MAIIGLKKDFSLAESTIDAITHNTEKLKYLQEQRNKRKSDSTRACGINQWICAAKATDGLFIRKNCFNSYSKYL